MANVIAVSSLSANLHRKFIATARFTNQIGGLWEKTVINETLPKGQGGTFNWPKYSTFSATALTDGLPISTASVISTSSVAITPSEIGVMWIMTKKANDQASENVARAAGQLAANALKVKIDTDGIGLASGYSGTVAGTGVTLTAGHLSAAVARVRGNATEPGVGDGRLMGNPGGCGPITAMFHDFSYQPMANDLVGLGAGGANAYPIPDGPSALILKDYLMGRAFGANIVTNPNMTPNSTPDAANMIYGKNSAVIVWWDKFNEDSDKDVTLRGTVSVVTSDYGYAELVDAWGIYALAAASTPSS